MVPIPPFLSKYPKHKEFRRLIYFIEDNNYQNRIPDYSNNNGHVSFTYNFPGDETYMFEITLNSKFYNIMPVSEHQNLSDEIKKRYSELSDLNYGIEEKERRAKAEQVLFDRIKESIQ